MRRLLLTCTAAVFATAGIAGSPEAPTLPSVNVLPVAAASSGDWSGFYAGGLVSFDGGTLDYANPPGTPPFVSYTYDKSTSYGGFVGYNMQRGNLVFGAEADYNSGGIFVAGFPAEATTYTVDLKGRVGFAFGNALVYGVVGYSMTEWSTIASYSAGGISYGGGVDYMMGNHMFVGAEYLARDMRGEQSGGSGNEGHSQIQSAQIRIGWKF